MQGKNDLNLTQVQDSFGCDYLYCKQEPYMTHKPVAFLFIMQLFLIKATFIIISKLIFHVKI